MAPVDQDKLRHHVQHVRDNVRRLTEIHEMGAVHLYDEIAAGDVFQIIDGHLSDYQSFLAPIVGRYFADE